MNHDRVLGVPNHKQVKPVRRDGSPGRGSLIRRLLLPPPGVAMRAVSTARSAVSGVRAARW